MKHPQAKLVIGNTEIGQLSLQYMVTSLIAFFEKKENTHDYTSNLCLPSPIMVTPFKLV